MKKTITVLSLVLSGVLVIVWPLIAYTSIFVFDAPLSNAFEQLLRGSIVAIAISYPVTYAVVMFIVVRSWRQSRLTYKHAVLALLPILQFALPPLLASTVGHHLEYQKREIAAGLFLGKEGSAEKIFLKHGDVYQELLGPEIIYYRVTSNRDFILAKQAKWEKWGDKGSSVDFRNLRYFAISTATHTLDGPYTQALFASRFGLQDLDPLFHETKLP